MTTTTDYSIIYTSWITTLTPDQRSSIPSIRSGEKNNTLVTDPQLLAEVGSIPIDKDGTTSPMPLNQTTHPDDGILVKESFNRLEKWERAIIKGLYQGYSPHQIAVLLGVHHSKILRLINRMRKKAREM